MIVRIIIIKLKRILIISSDRVLSLESANRKWGEGKPPSLIVKKTCFYAVPYEIEKIVSRTNAILLRGKDLTWISGGHILKKMPLALLQIGTPPWPQSSASPLSSSSSYS